MAQVDAKVTVLFDRPSEDLAVGAASSLWGRLNRSLAVAGAYVETANGPTYRYASDRFEVTYWLSGGTALSNAQRHDLKRAAERICEETPKLTVTSADIVL